MGLPPLDLREIRGPTKTDPALALQFLHNLEQLLGDLLTWHNEVTLSPERRAEHIVGFQELYDIAEQIDLSHTLNFGNDLFERLHDELQI